MEFLTLVCSIYQKFIIIRNEVFVRFFVSILFSFHGTSFTRLIRSVTSLTSLLNQYFRFYYDHCAKVEIYFVSGRIMLFRKKYSSAFARHLSKKLPRRARDLYYDRSRRAMKRLNLIHIPCCRTCQFYPTAFVREVTKINVGTLV